MSPLHGGFSPAVRVPPQRASPCPGSRRGRPRAARVPPRATWVSSRVAVRVGRRVAALEVDLVRALLERREKSAVEAEAPFVRGVDHGRPALDAVGIELFIPAGVKRVAEICTAPVSAQLDHLRSAVQRSAFGMGGPANDATEVQTAGLFGLEWVAHVELQELAGPPGGYVEPLVVERQIDVSDQGRHGFEPLEERRQVVGIRRLGGYLDDLFHLVRRAVQVPGPDRRAQVFEACYDANEAVSVARVVSRPQLQHHLVFFAEVDLLPVPALGQVPDVQLVAVLARKQDVGVDAVLHHVRRAPFACDRGVVAEVPPEVIGETLRAAVELPAALHGKRVVVDYEDTAWRVALRITQSAHVDPIRAAVDCVWPAVAGAFGDFLSPDRVHELRPLWVGFDVEDVDARRAKTWHEEVAPFKMRVGRVGAERRAANVPAEMMKLVSGVGCLDAPYLLPVGPRRRVDVKRHQGVGAVTRWVEGNHVGERFDRRPHGKAGRRIEGLVWSDQGGCQLASPFSRPRGRISGMKGQVACGPGLRPGASDLAGTEAVGRFDQPMSRESQVL